MLLLTFIEKLKDMKAQAAQLPANEATIGAEQQRLHDLQEKRGRPHRASGTKQISYK